MVQKAWKSTSAAFVLPCVAGLVDAVGYIQLYDLFMGFMSGNSILMGLNLGMGHWNRAFLHMIPIFWFLVGVGSGTQLMAVAANRGIRARTGLMLSIEAALICAQPLPPILPPRWHAATSGFATIGRSPGLRNPVSSEDLQGLRFLLDQGPPGLDIAAGEYRFVLHDFHRAEGSEAQKRGEHCPPAPR